MNRRRRVAVVLGLSAALAIGGGVYAITASNTVPVSRAGAGSAAVYGYTVTNLHYSLNTTTPVNIDQMTFTISPGIPRTGPGKVSVDAQLYWGATIRYSCTTDTAGTNVTCATSSPQLTATNIGLVTVTAGQ